MTHARYRRRYHDLTRQIGTVREFFPVGDEVYAQTEAMIAAVLGYTAHMMSDVSTPEERHWHIRALRGLRDMMSTLSEIDGCAENRMRERDELLVYVPVTLPLPSAPTGSSPEPEPLPTAWARLTTDIFGEA